MARLLLLSLLSLSSVSLLPSTLAQPPPQYHKHDHGKPPQPPKGYQPVQPYRTAAAAAVAAAVGTEGMEEVVHPSGSRTLLPGRGSLREEGREGGLGSRVIEWEEEVAAVSASFKKAMDGFNASTAKETTGNYDPFWPACPIFDAANELGSKAGCGVLSFFRRFVTDLPENYSHPMMFLPDDPQLEDTYAVPFAFDGRGAEKKRTLPLTRVAPELPTYHLLYRVIFYLVKYTFQTEDNFIAGRKIPELPTIVKGWKDQRLYWFNLPIRGTDDFRLTPYALSMVSEDGSKMIFVTRGTLWQEEWIMDFEYSYSTDPLAEKLFPGHVHSGIFKMFNLIQEEVIQEVLRVNPKHVLVGGHSLGGAEAILHGYNIQQVLQRKGKKEGKEAGRVDTVAIGALEAGDQHFVDGVAEVLNQRHMIYVGDGAVTATDKDGKEATGTEYRIGDVFAQYTCGAYMGCDSLGTGPTGVRWPYARAWNQVPFTARNLPNTARFQQAENLSPITGDLPVPSFRNLVSGHICSYQCLFSTYVGDKDFNLCSFKDQQPTTGGLPDEKLCYFPELPY
ncbi:hypothetical protein VYU27_009449 [Nannochloropsis oceanica]